MHSICISGHVFAAKYEIIPTVDLYFHFSLKAGPRESAPTGSPVVGVLTPFAYLLGSLFL